MNLFVARMVVVCALAISGRVIAAGPVDATPGSRQVLLEFVVLEVEGGCSHPLTLPPGGTPASAPHELGGFSYTAGTSAGLDSTLAALERQARVKIVNRPRIQTSHDTPATLFVGEVANRKPPGWPENEPLMIGLTLAVNPLI